MGGKIAPISFSVLWPLFSPKDLHKAYESLNTNFQTVEHFDNSLPGQHSLNCTLTKRNDSCKGYIDFFVTKSKISDKCQKSSPSTLSEVPGSYCGFKRNDPIPSIGKGFGNNRTVSLISYKRLSFN